MNQTVMNEVKKVSVLQVNKKCRKSKLKSLPLVERKFVHISHLVLCDYSVIFIDYDKYLYQDKIQEIVQKIIKESQKSSLY